MLSLLPAPNQPPRRRVRAISPFLRRPVHSGQRIGLTTIRFLAIIPGYRAGSFYRGYSYPSQVLATLRGRARLAAVSGFASYVISIHNSVLLKLLGSLAYNGRRWGIYAGQLASAKPGNLAKPAGLRAGRGLSSLPRASSWTSRRRRESIAKPRPTKRAPRWICTLTGIPTAGRRIIWSNTSGAKPRRLAFTAGLGIYRKRRMMC